MTSGYLPVNGLEMYYESHGKGGTPLVLLHGAFSAVGTSFGLLIPALAETRRVIAFDLQAHGRTADIDRSMRLETLADDVAAALELLGIDRADVLGYSMGGAVALRIAIRHPAAVRKLILISVSYTLAGLHPGLMDGLGEMQPEMMHGSPWHDEYMQIAPRPEDFNRLFTKKSEMDRHTTDIPAATLRAIQSPILLIAGDSDILTPEHAVEMFRLFGGGRFGDSPEGLPDSQLAILPGTSHVSIVFRPELLLPIIPLFLDGGSHG
jgi:pimeloyl-ACP methyl ester carboxylesterase